MAPLGVRDVTISAGRKEAAKLYPIDREAPCEWSGLANAGGGLFPIVGCIAGKQVHRHHGPDKTTTNNDPSNIHRICKSCHERWHAKNNGPYETDPSAYRRLPHKPRAATIQELMDGKAQIQTGQTQEESEDKQGDD